MGCEVHADTSFSKFCAWVHPLRLRQESQVENFDSRIDTRLNLEELALRYQRFLMQEERE